MTKVNFLLFGGDNYYPAGGYNDLIATAFSEDELRELIEENQKKPKHSFYHAKWWQIVNANTHTIIDKGVW
ncbi:hypothetical protein CPTAKMNP4_131 [Salmonella phage vB_SenM-AKM_NP4]|uniref:Uncharacterized protein n=2 Tax=Gelderlandvirus TaxID=1913653 RepID=M1EAM8_BPS16|nr:hypothetical protein I133_gp140 [Salmonella phage vB_SenM-S16]YP_009126332.1 hypothetical protein STP4a_125 [Salmonella phage STP4-a]WDR21792.1 hypothetical protein PJM34_0124 [Salmonella phage vB_SenM_UTK0003]WLI71753.1 hypothetical protein CPTAKMNP4_131 [Salmonella phage vB_SenM-AKM_NP4]AEO97079.1 hypothetical protein [Salmonella phage vB_SenM-S16]AHJ86979.1 hypothetical protein STP4a_125 [Salmonella phage STP4-a]